MEWGYHPYDAPPPVVYNVGQPAGRHRPRGRRPTDAPQFYTGPRGELLVPAGHQRATSMSGPRPSIQIVNEQVYTEDGRARSIVYPEEYYYRRDRPRSHSHGRSHSRSHSRSPMTREEQREAQEHEEKFRRLEELEKRDEEREREKKYKEKMILEKAKEEMEKKEQEEMKKKAVEEWKEKEREKKEKEKAENEKAEKAAEERMRKMLWDNGYTQTQIEAMVNKSEKKEHGQKVSSSKVIALSRPTYLRIKKKYLDTETLDIYQLPWQWDEDDNYIIIKQWLNERDQEKLFEHTRKLRETKRLTYTTTQLRKDKDNQLLLVKKKEKSKSKSPVRVYRF